MTEEWFQFFCLLKCTFEKVDFLRYALTVSLPPIFYAARRTEPDMILIPDDEPELSLPAASEEFLRRCQVRMPRSARPGPTCFHSIPTAAGRPWPRS